MTFAPSVPDTRAVHVEGDDACVKYPLLMTAELLNQLLAAAYGRGVTVTIKDRGPDGYCDVEVREVIETSLVPTADVIYAMQVEDLLRRFLTCASFGGATYASCIAAIRNRAKHVLRPFSRSEIIDEMRLGWTGEDEQQGEDANGEED